VGEGYCCNCTERETLQVIVALQDERNPGATSSSFKLQAYFLEVGKKGSVVKYLMHDFDVLRAAKPSDCTYPKEPSLGQIWAADIPAASASFWLIFSPLKEKIYVQSRHEVLSSARGEQQNPAPIQRGAVSSQG